MTPDKHQVEKVKRPRSAAALLAVSFCPQMGFILVDKFFQPGCIRKQPAVSLSLEENL